MLTNKRNQYTSIFIGSCKERVYKSYGRGKIWKIGKGKFKELELDNIFIVPSTPFEVYLRKVMLIGQIEKFPKLLNYLKKSVSFWRSNTYCIEPSGSVALKIIDVKWDQVNHLDLGINTYRSAEE